MADLVSFSLRPRPHAKRLVVFVLALVSVSVALLPGRADAIHDEPRAAAPGERLNVLGETLVGIGDRRVLRAEDTALHDYRVRDDGSLESAGTLELGSRAVDLDARDGRVIARLNDDRVVLLRVGESPSKITLAGEVDAVTPRMVAVGDGGFGAIAMREGVEFVEIAPDGGLTRLFSGYLPGCTPDDVSIEGRLAAVACRDGALWLAEHQDRGGARVWPALRDLYASRLRFEDGKLYVAGAIGPMEDGPGPFVLALAVYEADAGAESDAPLGLQQLLRTDMQMGFQELQTFALLEDRIYLGRPDPASYTLVSVDLSVGQLHDDGLIVLPLDREPRAIAPAGDVLVILWDERISTLVRAEEAPAAALQHRSVLPCGAPVARPSGPFFDVSAVSVDRQRVVAAATGCRNTILAEVHEDGSVLPSAPSVEAPPGYPIGLHLWDDLVVALSRETEGGIHLWIGSWPEGEELRWTRSFDFDDHGIRSVLGVEFVESRMVLASDVGLSIFELSSTEAARLVDRRALDGLGQGLAIDGRHIVAGLRSGGMVQLELEPSGRILDTVASYDSRTLWRPLAFAEGRLFAGVPESLTSWTREPFIDLMPWRPFVVGWFSRPVDGRLELEGSSSVPRWYPFETGELDVDLDFDFRELGGAAVTPSGLAVQIEHFGSRSVFSQLEWNEGDPRWRAAFMHEAGHGEWATSVATDDRWLYLFGGQAGRRDGFWLETYEVRPGAQGAELVPSPWARLPEGLHRVFVPFAGQRIP